MARRAGRRVSVRISLGRAARLHRLVKALSEAPAGREELLDRLGVGLRTFYRELQLLRRLGVRVALKAGRYDLRTDLERSEALLPFPDPQLSFAEISELARTSGPAGRRLAELLRSVVDEPTPAAPKPTRASKSKAKGGPGRGGKPSKK